MIKRALTTLLLLSLFIVSKSQLPALEQIPEEIKKNAYSVIRFSETNFEVISEKEAKEKNVLIMTILNNKGLDHANFIENVDKGKELKKFSCEIFDYSGKSIKKFKKSDLNLTDYSGFNLADDLSYYYLDRNRANLSFHNKI